MAPMLLSWLATGVLGGLSVHRQVTDILPVLDIVQNQGIEASIPAVLSSLPISAIVLILFTVIATIFLITTLDSTTYTVATYMSNQDMSKSTPYKSLRILVAVLITVLALTLMSVGGLSPLEVLSGLMGIPIIIIQILTVFAAKKMMDEDRAWVKNVRKARYSTTQQKD